MYVPDDAKKRRHADGLTPAAWYVYESHCQARSNKTGLSRVTKEGIAEREGLALKTVYNAVTELKRKDWIREEKGGVRPLVGDFSPVDKRHQQPSLFRPQAVPESGKAAPQTGSEIPYTGKEIPGLGNSVYMGSRARSYQPSDQPDQPATHTHLSTQPARARGGREGEGVCVSIGKSKFSKPDLRVYGDAKGLGEGWVTAAWRSGEWDAEVEKYLARREQVLDCRAPAGEDVMPFHAAAQFVHSVAQVPGYDVAGYIARMEGVSEETRARLRERFLSGPGVEAVAARARSPP